MSKHVQTYDHWKKVCNGAISYPMLSVVGVPRILSQRCEAWPNAVKSHRWCELHLTAHYDRSQHGQLSRHQGLGNVGSIATASISANNFKFASFECSCSIIPEHPNTQNHCILKEINNFP